MSVYEKMLNVMAKVGYIQKDGFVETTRGKGYKALTDEKVLSIMRPVMVEEGLLMLPVKMTHTRIDEKVRTNDGGERINRITDVDVTYRIIDAKNPSDFVDVVSSGTGVDTQDKGIGKAMTYSKKYALLNSFLVPSGDDTDSISSEKYTDELLNGKGMPPAAPTEPSAPMPAAQGAPMPEDENSTVKSDRKINISTCISMAQMYGKDKLINEAGYNGIPWDQLSDEKIARCKVWLVACGKKAGAA